MRLKVIACEVMKEELLAAAADTALDFEFVTQGLHSHPEKLNVELQKMLDGTAGYSRVVLAFGLCGGVPGTSRRAISPSPFRGFTTASPSCSDRGRDSTRSEGRSREPCI